MHIITATIRRGKNEAAKMFQGRFVLHNTCFPCYTKYNV